MATKIKKLSITAFRGATQNVEIIFDTLKPVILVFGENGTGKSTIADALDFVCNRRFGSLEDRSMSTQPKSHAVSLGQDPKTLRVSLSTSSGDFIASLTKTGPSISPNTGCPDARILRRSNILKLLDAPPKDRFEELKAFITVPGIERSENALREATKDIKRNYDEATRAAAQANTALEELWESEAKPDKSALDWAATEANKDVAALEGTIKSISAIETAFQSVEETLSALDRSITELSSAHTALVRAEEAQKAAESKQSLQNTQLLKLLQDARAYIAARKPIPCCPICEQKIHADSLILQLDRRVAEMNELADTVSAVARAKHTFDSKEAIVNQSRQNFLRRTKELGDLLKGCSLNEVKGLMFSWTDFDDIFKQDLASESREKKARELWAAVQPCRQRLATRKRTDQKSIDQRNAIKGHYDAHAEKLRTAKGLAELSQKLDKALEIVARQRKAYIEGVLGAIAGETERLYKKLHPGEGIGKIRFYLKPSAIGSLDFDAQFLNKPEVPPQAYYSESHLDTLGICVFLALARHFKGDNTIIVLDDVVTSVDGPHLDRFMELLHDEAPHFNQVIVTTHYRPWKDRYRYARGPAANTQIIELRGWNPTSGIQTDEAITAVAELKAVLGNPKFDRQSVASKAGIQLENILDFLTYQYRCRLPRQTDPNYTLGDLAAGIDSKLGRHLKVAKTGIIGQPKIEMMLKTLVDNATAQAWVRNRAGCHFHSLSAEISDAEIRDFASKVVCLAETIICAECECFPTRRPTGSFWQCECGKVELHPLIPPGAPLGTVAAEE
jgi:hypothetical protein